MWIDENELENIYKFNELYENGIRPGDIVAIPSNRFECGISWNYVLLRDGFPQEYNTALCCHSDPRTPEKMHLYQIGFHWCGDISSQFRIATDGEKEKFITACIDALNKPIESQWGWGEVDYCEILHSMLEWGLINQIEANELNKKLKKVHGADLLKLYKKTYGE